MHVSRNYDAIWYVISYNGWVVIGARIYKLWCYQGSVSLVCINYNHRLLTWFHSFIISLQPCHFWIIRILSYGICWASHWSCHNMTCLNNEASNVSIPGDDQLICRTRSVNNPWQSGCHIKYFKIITMHSIIMRKRKRENYKFWIRNV